VRGIVDDIIRAANKEGYSYCCNGRVTTDSHQFRPENDIKVKDRANKSPKWIVMLQPLEQETVLLAKELRAVAIGISVGFSHL
jgi:hypothetical protein